MIHGELLALSDEAHCRLRPEAPGGSSCKQLGAIAPVGEEYVQRPGGRNAEECVQRPGAEIQKSVCKGLEAEMCLAYQEHI